MFEKLSRHVSLARLIFYGSLLLFLPFLFLFFHFFSQLKTMRSISSQLEKTTLLYLQKENKQSFNKACQKHYAKKDKYALERALEKLPLMKKEREEIEKAMSKSSFFGNKSLEERLLFLKGKENKITFIESNAVAKMGIEEIEETLAHPIEIDHSDFKEILTLIEGNHPLFSQALILDFHIKKLVKESGNEVFICDMKLLKREFL